MTGSLIIGLLFKILSTLNRYYENSMTHRVTSHLAKWLDGSLAARCTGKLFREDWDINYSSGSLIFRLIYWISHTVAIFSSKIYGVFSKIGRDGFFYKTAALVLARPAAALGAVLDDSFFKRITLRFVWGEDVKAHSLYKLLSFEIPLMGFLFAACLIPHEYWSNTYILLAAILLCGLYFLRVASGKNSVGIIKSLPPAFVVYAGLSAASMLITNHRSDSLRIFLIFISCLIFFALIQSALFTKELFEAFISIMFFAMTLASLFGIYQYNAGIEVRADLVDLVASAGLMRLFSTMDNPNNFAEFLVLLLPLSIAHVITRKTDLEKLFYALLLAPCVLALVLTYSRAALLVAVAAFGIFVLIINPRLMPLFIIAFIVSIPFIPASITNRILTIGKDTSSTYRLMIWQGALKVLEDNWLVGVGMGPGAYGRIYKPVANPLAMTAMHSHNLILQIWIETGVFAFMSFITLIFTTFKNCVARSFSGDGYKYYLAAAAATIPAIFVFSMVEYIWFYPRVMLMFWVFLGLAVKAIALSRRSAKAE